MHVTRAFRALGAMLVAPAVFGLAVMVDVTGTAAAQSAGSSAPGVTPTSITVGSISTQTGTLAANFAPMIYGERAYFDYINAQGGVNGRKIDYRYALDDGGNPSTFNQLANTLINQDRVFAVTGVGTAFFTPNLFVESGIPTYGYNVTGNWAGPPNLFAAGGSVEYYPAGAPLDAFVARKTTTHPSIAIVAYGVAASANACQAAQNVLQSAGYDVSYVDLKVNYPGTTVATDVQRMKQSRSNFVMSCMDVQGNINMARAIQQYGVKATELWFNGNDQSTLNQNRSLMQNVYFDTSHVPFTASTKLYPALKLYLTEMKKYEPSHTYDELAIQGWVSAAFFVQGVKMAGNDLTWANVIKADNSLTAFTAGGLRAPTNWARAGHSGHAPPYCSALIQVHGDTFVPALNTGHNVFNCFESLDAHKNPVFPLPPGTPRPA
jgi:branched-chain amino acid transport system substrate-binding protein